ncbi:hypothetical protein D7I43_20735 [Micromonospora globbae]|uniref:Uncharacterized protein n=1 Tax=Micromonospora globbae TaxID=1894969 RepID=A0A420EXN5_9ACTN|nr:hypothetical protein D7I43_20735 [Micromonospora globbae]
MSAGVRMRTSVQDTDGLDEHLSRPVGGQVGAGGDGGLLPDRMGEQAVQGLVPLHPRNPVGDDHLCEQAFREITPHRARRDHLAGCGGEPRGQLVPVGACDRCAGERDLEELLQPARTVGAVNVGAPAQKGRGGDGGGEVPIDGVDQGDQAARLYIEQLLVAADGKMGYAYRGGLPAGDAVGTGAFRPTSALEGLGEPVRRHPARMSAVEAVHPQQPGDAVLVRGPASADGRRAGSPWRSTSTTRESVSGPHRPFIARRAAECNNVVTKRD